MPLKQVGITKVRGSTTGVSILPFLHRRTKEKEHREESDMTLRPRVLDHRISSLPTPPISTSPTPETSDAEVGTGDKGGGGPACLRGLKISTTINPKMIKSSKNMHFLLPVFC